MLKTAIPMTVDTERLLRVKRNRQIQLQRWIYYEKNQINNTIQNENNKKIEFSKDIILLEAVSRNDLNEVKELLNQGANPNSSTVDGLTGLHQCCIDNFLEMAQLLIKFNANVNAIDTEKWTPLHAAATCGNGQMCLLLSKHGCNFLALNSDGNMPYDICEGDDALKIIESEMGKKGITQQQIDEARTVPEQQMLKDVKIINQYKGNLDEIDSQGAALIHIACSQGYNEIVQTLLEAGANYQLPDKDGWLPIHLATCWNHVDIVEFLVVFGADIDLPNSKGETIFDLCDPEIRSQLLYIKENISDIRKNYNFSFVPSNKLLRRSRGSSVRRTSVRQKNMLSKKEAKDEYIALIQTISSTDKKSNSRGSDATTHIPSTIEECSDVDSIEVKLQSPKVTVQSLKIEDVSFKKAISTSNKSNTSIPHQKITYRTSPPKHLHQPNITSSPDQTQSKPEPQHHVESKTKANHTNDEKKRAPCVEYQRQSDNEPRPPPVVAKTTDCYVDALNKPKYVFSSTTENWDNKKEYKRRRGKECCLIL